MRESLERLVERFGPGFLPGVGFAVAAVAATQVVYAPYLFEHLRAVGWAEFAPGWASHRVLPALFVAVVSLLALRTSTRSGAEMVERPARFVAVLIGSGSAALALVWGLVFTLDPPATAGALFNDKLLMFEAWIGLLDWGCLFGWFYFLTLRRREDRLRLSLMLGQQALLKRQVAQQRLVAARAQIDPLMVARVLRAVRSRAAAKPDAAADDTDAATLIDQLASYLRLALNRVHDQAPSLASDLALIRSLAALRQAETGIRIDLQITSRVPGAAKRPASAAFLITRTMLDAALQHARDAIALRLITHTGGLAIDIVRDGPDASDDEHARHASAVAALLPGVATLRHPTDTGLLRHAAHVPLE